MLLDTWSLLLPEQWLLQWKHGLLSLYSTYFLIWAKPSAILSRNELSGMMLIYPSRSSGSIFLFWHVFCFHTSCMILSNLSLQLSAGSSATGLAHNPTGIRASSHLPDSRMEWANHSGPSIKRRPQKMEGRRGGRLLDGEPKLSQEYTPWEVWGQRDPLPHCTAVCQVIFTRAKG